MDYPIFDAKGWRIMDKEKTIHDTQEAEELISIGQVVRDTGSGIKREQAPPIESAGDGIPYSKVLQGKPIHGLIASSASPRNITIDPATHAGTINNDGVIITIDEEAIQDISPQTFKVLIILLTAVTSQLQSGAAANADNINRGRAVKISLDEYMEACKTKDRKEARAQLNDAIKALYAVSLEWDETSYERPDGKSRKVKTTKHHRLRITDHTITQEEGNPVKRGVAEFRFSFDMAEYLSNAYIMPYPIALLSINTHYHPYSIPIGWKLCALYNVNYGNDKRRNITTVETLLRAAKGIPRYADMAAKGKIYERIIRPFDRDLAALEEAGVISSYWYFDDEGNRIDPILLGGLSYAEFSALNVHYEMRDYPDQTPRLEAKSKRIKAAISRNRRAAKKKAEEAGEAGDGAR